MTSTKKAYLWVVNWGVFGIHKTPYVTADLFFSSREKFWELLGTSLPREEQLVEVDVPIDFVSWDYIPDNY